MSVADCINYQDRRWRELPRGSAIGNNAHDVGVGAELAVDFRFATHALNARADAQSGDFQNQRVSGNNRAAKASFLDSGEKDQLVIAVLDFPQCEHRAHLRQGFHHQDSRHHRRTRKMTLKEWLVNRDLFDADDSYFRD